MTWLFFYVLYVDSIEYYILHNRIYRFLIYFILFLCNILVSQWQSFCGKVFAINFTFNLIFEYSCTLIVCVHVNKKKHIHVACLKKTKYTYILLPLGSNISFIQVSKCDPNSENEKEIQMKLVKKIENKINNKVIKCLNKIDFKH